MVHLGEDMILYIYAFHFADNVLYRRRIISFMTLVLQEKHLLSLGFQLRMLLEKEAFQIHILILSLIFVLS